MAALGLISFRGDLAVVVTIGRTNAARVPVFFNVNDKAQTLALTLEGTGT